MRLFVLVVAGALAVVTLTCATTQNPNAAKYPPRGRRCHVSVYDTPTPGVKEWDDLGVARVECPLDVGRVQCMARLREAACRMGGDLLYDVPRKGSRPGEQAMVFMGHVAHTRLSSDAGAAAGDEGADAGAESAFDTTSPVEPLNATAPVTVPADAGRD